MGQTFTYEIKRRSTGHVLFAAEIDGKYEGEADRFKRGLAVKAAVGAGADLGGADLRYADLRYADLRGAGLRYADLRYADLRATDLRGAGLRGADLRATDLRGAGLRGADLRGADLRYADLRDAKWRGGITINRRPLFVDGLPWPVTILDDHMEIGCELHTLADWAAFDDKRILEMDGKRALTFWRAHKDALLALAASDGRGSAAIAKAEGGEG